MTVHHGNTFAHFSELLGARETRKLANNTYCVRRDSETIAIKLHATDVVTYHADGTVTLRSGGYETVTTKDRIKNFGPDGIAVYAEKRVWFVSDRFSGAVTPFLDGMRFDPDHLIETTAHYRSATDDLLSKQKQTDASVSRFVRKLTPELLSNIVAEASRPMGMLGDCLLCRVELSDITENGRKAKSLTSGDVEHITSHISESYWHASLILCALRWAGYVEFQLPTVIRHHDITTRAVRRYLRSRLISAPKAEVPA